MLQPHDEIAGFGGYHEILRQALALHDQGVIARNLKSPRQGAEYALAGMADRRELAVHRLRRADNVATVGLADGLMAEADAQDRHFGPRLCDQLEANAGLVGGAGAGRQDDPLRGQLQDLDDRNFIVAEHLAACAELAQVVHEIIGKAVIVIDQDQHGNDLGDRYGRGQARAQRGEAARVANAPGHQLRRRGEVKVASSPALGLTWDHWASPKVMTASPAVGNLLASRCRSSDLPWPASSTARPCMPGSWPTSMRQLTLA